MSNRPDRDFSFAVPVPAVRAALAELRHVAPRKPTLPILGCILIERERGATRFTATDLDLRLTYTLPSPFPEPTSELGRKLADNRSAREDGAVAIPVPDLAAVVKAADPNSDLAIDNRKLSFRINGAVARSDAAFMDVEEFPAVSQFDGPLGALPDATRDAILLTSPSASVDETRYVLLGVYLDRDLGHVVATDGRHLCAVNTPIVTDSFILPSFTIKRLARFANLPWSIRNGRDEENAITRAEFRIGPNWTLQTKTVEGNFPNWPNVIPDDYEKGIVDDKGKQQQPPIPPIALTTFVREQMRDLLKRLPKNEKSEHDGVLLNIQNGLLRFSVGAAAFTVVVPGNHTKRQVMASRRFWQRMIDVGCTEMRVKDEQSPVLGIGKTVRFVFMPLRIT